jgi:hypothetical protein
MYAATLGDDDYTDNKTRTRPAAAAMSDLLQSSQSSAGASENVLGLPEGT